MNNVCIIGRIASEPLKFHIEQFNKNIIKFAIAVDTRARKTDGKKETWFFEIEAWDVVGDKIYEYCKTGDKVGINGHLEQAKFVRKDGSKGSMVKIVASGVEFLSDKHPKEARELEEDALKDEQNETINDEDVPF